MEALALDEAPTQIRSAEIGRRTVDGSAGAFAPLSRVLPHPWPPSSVTPSADNGGGAQAD